MSNIDRARQGASNTSGNRPAISDTTFKDKTPGAEHVVFRAGKDACQGLYKTDMERLLVCASLSVKRGGAMLARAMRTMAFPAPKFPKKPTDANTPNYNFKMEKYKEGLKRASQQHFSNQDNNLQA